MLGAKQGMAKKDWDNIEITFGGCIIDPDSKEPQKLTTEQSEQLAELLYASFKKWYYDDHCQPPLDRTRRKPDDKD